MSLSQVFSYNALVHAISGTVGGSCAMTLFYPLDNIRTFLQVDNSQRSSLEILTTYIKEEGFSTLYRGLIPVLISLGFSNFVYFYSNNMLKAIFKKLTGQKEISIALNLLVASIAGCINVFTTCPLWVANTRLKLKKTGKGLFSTVLEIAKEEGILSLWNGCMASLVLVSNPTIHFVVYDKIKQIAMERAKLKGRKHLDSLEIFIIGAIAKAAATILTYPIQLAQSRMRAMKGGGHGHGHGSVKKTTEVKETKEKETKEEIKVEIKENKDTKEDTEDPKKPSETKTTPKKDSKPNKEEHYSGTLDCLIKIFQRDGFFGWFRGLHVKILQTVLTAAFQFMAYEKIVRIIFSIFKVDSSNLKISE